MTRPSIKNALYVIGKTAKYHKVLIPLIIISAIAQGANLLVFPVISKVILGVAEGGGDFTALLGQFLPVAAAVLILHLAGALTDNSLIRHTEHARVLFAERRVRKAFEIDYSYMEKSDILDLQRKASEADNSGNAGIVGMLNSMRNLFANFVGVVLAAVIIFGYNYIVIACMIAVCIVRMLAINAAKKYDKKYIWDMMAPFWRRIDYLHQSSVSLDFAKDVRLYGMKKWMLEKHIEISRQAHKLIRRSKMNWIRFTTVNQLLVLVSDVILYGWLIISTLDGEIKIADFMLCYGAVYTFVESTNRFFENIVEIKQFSMQIDDYRNFVEIPHSYNKNKCRLIPKFEKFKLSCQNLSFKYPGRDTYSLKNINLTITAGQKLAIVGINGAGKTTLIKLLLRLYEPTEGTIFLNGIDIREFDKEEYYRLFSPVFQDVEPMAFTLYENVSMCSLEHTDTEKVERCLEMAGLSAKLTMLHGGAKAKLGKGIHESGTELSGGEKQKLMFARALYKNAPIVILDEPTAALDALAESKQYENFNQLAGGNTTIYISHRLSSTKFCDAIAMFDGGSMVEYGTHDELLAKNGRYAELFEVQAQYYKDNENEEETES